MASARFKSLFFLVAVGLLPTAYSACEMSTQFSAKTTSASGVGSQSTADPTPTPNPSATPAPSPTPSPTPAAACSVQPKTIAHSAGIGDVNPNPDRLFFVDQSAYPNAMCSDGSRPAFMVRRGVGAAQNRWIVFLEGGGLCTTLEECAPRVTQNLGHLVSSEHMRITPSQAKIGSGIAAGDRAINPDFYDASVIRIFYCSSDFYFGRRRGNGTFSETSLDGWNFMGHENLMAVLADARANHGLDQAEEVLLAGSSAGAIGAALNGNEVKGLFGSSVRFLVFADSGLPLRYPAYDPQTAQVTNPPEYPGEQTLANALALWQPELDPQCLATARAQSLPDQTCLSSSYLVSQPLLTAPFFLLHSLADTNFLGRLGVPFGGPGGVTPAPAAASYLQGYVDASRAFLSSVQPLHSPFGIAQPFHTLAHTTKFNTSSFAFAGGDFTVAAALKAWYERPCPATPLIQ